MESGVRGCGSDARGLVDPWGCGFVGEFVGRFVGWFVGGFVGGIVGWFVGGFVSVFVGLCMGHSKLRVSMDHSNVSFI